jgi:hypothetical protein
MDFPAVGVTLSCRRSKIKPPRSGQRLLGAAWLRRARGFERENSVATAVMGDRQELFSRG